MQKMQKHVVAVIVIINILFSAHTCDATNAIRFTAMTVVEFLLFIYAFVSNKKRLQVPDKWIFTFYVSFLALYIISCLQATNMAEALFASSKCLLELFMAISVFNLVENDEEKFLQSFSDAAVIVLLFVTVVASIQVCSSLPISRGNSYFVKGLSLHKNTFASLLYFLLPFITIRLFTGDKRRTRFIVICLLVIDLSLIGITRCRSVYLAILTASLYFSFLYATKKKRKTHPGKAWTQKRITTFALISCLLLVFFFLYPLRMILEDASQLGIITALNTDNERFALWYDTYELFDRKPIFGHGIGNWKIVMPSISYGNLFRADFMDKYFFRPHNEFLSVLSEGGIIVFILLLFTICLAAISWTVSILRLDGERFLTYSLLLSSLVGSFMISFFDYPHERVELIIWYAILSGCLFHTVKKNEKQRGIPAFARLCSSFILCFMVIIGIERIKGEYTTSDILTAEFQNDYQRMKESCNRFNTYFYSFTPTGNPVSYYQGIACRHLCEPSAESFRKACSFAPFHKESLLELGKAEYEENNDIEKAISLFNQAIAISPNYSEPYFELSELYIRQNQSDEAKATLNRFDIDKKIKVFDKNINYYVDPDSETKHDLMEKHILEKIRKKDLLGIINCDNDISNTRRHVCGEPVSE